LASLPLNLWKLNLIKTQLIAKTIPTHIPWSLQKMQFLDILSRWTHVGTAIVIVGGSVFLRFVVMPTAAELPDDEHQMFRERILARWRKFTGAGIGLFLLSGFYNYLVVAMPYHKGDKLYSALLGIKMLLAFIVFFLASALAGRSAKFEPLRQNAAKWLAITILLAAVIIGISGFLKFRPPITKGSALPSPAEGLNHLLSPQFKVLISTSKYSCIRSES
jgi:uncharacterized membrane protein